MLELFDFLIASIFFLVYIRRLVIKKCVQHNTGTIFIFHVSIHADLLLISILIYI